MGYMGWASVISSNTLCVCQINYTLLYAEVESTILNACAKSSNKYLIHVQHQVIAKSSIITCMCKIKYYFMHVQNQVLFHACAKSSTISCMCQIKYYFVHETAAAVCDKFDAAIDDFTNIMGGQRWSALTRTTPRLNA
jgi:hypothetical protein